MNVFIERDKSSINNKWSFSKNNLMCFGMVFLGLFVIFSYGIGNVSAAGNVSGDNIYVDTNGNDSWDGQSSTHSGLTGPKLTLQNATGTVNKDGTINIANGYYNGAKNNNITITKNMNIKGQSKTGTIINGSGTNWIFHINNGIKVTISNLTLTNGTNPHMGGAIYNDGNLTLNNTIFSSNSAISQTITNGGAIYNTGSLIVTTSTFKDNIAGASGGTSGGSIYNTGAMDIRSTTFSGSIVGSGVSTYGGAIENSGGSLSKPVTITYCTFTNNIANTQKPKGGAISNSGVMTITNNNFTTNTANYGGAIYNTGTLTLAYNNFTNNNGFMEGSAINNNGGNLTITNCKFSGNNGDSGAIFNNGISNIKNSTFINNTSTNEAGAIENIKTLTLTESTFKNNTANTGGAIYGNAVVSSCTFQFNTAKINGGAIYTPHNSTITNCTFTNNTAILSGGGIYNNGVLNATSNIFNNNSASIGGAIYNGNTANIHFNQILGNVANYGNDIYNDGGTLNATLNWWGSNAGPMNKVQQNAGKTYLNPWLVLRVSAKPNTINTNSNTTITADLLHDNLGVYHAPIVGCVLNGKQVAFTSSYGTLNNPVTIVNGCAISTFKCGTKAGTVAIYTKFDNQTIKTVVTIKDPIILKVSSTTPSNNAQRVSLTSPISSNSLKILQLGANYSKIYVKNLTTGKIVTITKTISGNILTIKQTTSRLKNDTYQVYIPLAALKDKTGNNSNTYTFKFKTA